MLLTHPPCRPRSLEHSVENQLPFIQHIGGGVRFAIAPVCVGWLGSLAHVDALAGQLESAMRAVQQQGEPQPLLIATR